MSENTEIEIRPWIKKGVMLVNAYALDISDPDHVYNQILAMDKRPEDYGIKHPYAEEFENRSREELIEEIIKLRDELTGWVKADAFGYPGRPAIRTPFK